MCLTGRHLSCLSTSCACNQKSHQTVSVTSPTLTEESESEVDDDIRESLQTKSRKTTTGRTGPRQLKRDAALKDQQSTGRKRAARWYPLDREAPCEWRGLSNCGGNIGILGCYSGLQEARHHGPDKSTSNNEPGNVHRICHACHNRWHAKNNPGYDWAKPVSSPHTPRPQTDEEIKEAFLEYMAMMGGMKVKKIRD